MTTREEVRKAIIANTSDGYSGMRGGVDGAVNALMSLPALRLAEEAEGMSVLEAVMRLLELVEQNKDWKLAVVDQNQKVIPRVTQLQHGFELPDDCAKVIEVAP
jgi:hypothetical protein